MARTPKAPLRRRLPRIATCFALVAALLATAASPASAGQERGTSAADRHRPAAPRQCARVKRGARQDARRRVRRQRRCAAAKRRARSASARVAVSGNAAVSRPGPASGGDGVLDAGFEQGLANWNTAGVGEVVPAVVGDVVRSGSRSSYVALSGSQSRSELILGGNGGGSTDGMVEFREGDERWYAFSFSIESMVYGGPGAHNLIMQFKSDGEGSPNFGLQLWDYEGDAGDDGGRGLWSHGDAMGGDRFLAPLGEHAWHDVVIHFRASAADGGFYEVYLDGQLVDSRGGVSMIVPGHSYGYIKNGLYRNGDEIPGASQLRLDAVRLGRSAGAVVPG